MKKLMVATAVAMLAGVASSWAVTNTFHVTQFRGTLVAASGAKTPVTATQLSTNHTILVVSDDAHLVVIAEIVSDTPTNVLNILMDQRRAAFTAGGKFNSAMKGDFSPLSPAVPDFVGDLQFTGKISPAPDKGTPKKVSASVIGVWSEDPDSTFKGTLQGQLENP